MPGKSDKLKAAGNSDLSYQQLRNWYLARLRKQALNQNEKNLTPAGLIHADKALIESLVMSSLEAQNKTSGEEDAEPAPGTKAAYFLYAAAVGFMILLFLNSYNGDFSAMLAGLSNLSLGALIFQARIAELYAKNGYSAPLLMFGIFSLPNLILAFDSCKSQRISAPKAIRRFGPATALTLLPAAVIAISLAGQAQSGGNNNHSDLRLESGLYAWISLLSFHLGLELRTSSKSTMEALQRKLLRACSSGADSGIASPDNYVSESPPALLDRLIKQRDELLNRETLIADASSDLLFVLADDQTLLACNWTIQAHLGYLPQELLQKTFCELLLPQDQKLAQHTLALCKTSKQNQTFDCRMLTNRKQAIDLRWTVEYSETQSCFFASAQNISNEKTLERARKEFVSMLGHDIRTPLTSALLSVQIAQKRLSAAAPEKAAAPLANVETSLKRLLLLLEELLEFEQLAGGDMKLERNDLDISSIIEQAIAETTEQAKHKSIKLLSDTQPCMLSADSGKLMRVIVNLISNAIKFSQADSSITVSSSNTAPGTVRVSVSDAGPGIAPEYQKLIFERYERLADTAHEEGSGLGLAIARAIVEAHGGMIGVESTIGRGSTFWFSLPQ